MGQTTFFRQKAGVVYVEDVMGYKVENPQGEKLGKIETLLLDLAEGRILCAVLSFGGFLGMGEKLFPIPLNALSFRADEKRVILNVDKEILKSAPGYDRDSLPNVNDREWASMIYTHYGYDPYW
jgi:sporulation protein YlmC with PRC-barrel domain